MGPCLSLEFQVSCLGIGPGRDQYSNAPSLKCFSQWESGIPSTPVITSIFLHTITANTITILIIPITLFIYRATASTTANSDLSNGLSRTSLTAATRPSLAPSRILPSVWVINQLTRSLTVDSNFESDHLKIIYTQ